MTVLALLPAVILGFLCAAVGRAHAASASAFGPSIETAQQRAPAIFNAVNDAMRQWGSSLHHNGMSLFLVTVPEGVLLHHGNGYPQSPPWPDWLAYEVEHAEYFARNWEKKEAERIAGDRDYQHQQHVLSSNVHSKDIYPGYLHVYRTTRDIRYLYVDGMGGGKTAMGTVDLQDILLLDDKEHRDHGQMGEGERARKLCALIQDWGLHGIVRMEAGFEIIHCDFADGSLDEIQALRRRIPKKTGGSPADGMENIEFIRGVAERYDGIGAGRTVVDYASMLSALFFPVNLTNPDPKRPDLPRLKATSSEDLQAIRDYVDRTYRHYDQVTGLKQRPIDWQDVTDLIVSRYADRLRYFVSDVRDLDLLHRDIQFLLDVYVDYDPDTKQPVNLTASIDSCTSFYLHAIVPETEADRLIKTALETVTHRICVDLFRVRQIVNEGVALEDQTGRSVEEAITVLRELMAYLNWARFKKCLHCAIDEVCFVPMWPVGTVEDYWHPQCTNGTQREGENYWGEWPWSG